MTAHSQAIQAIKDEYNTKIEYIRKLQYALPEEEMFAEEWDAYENKIQELIDERDAKVTALARAHNEAE